MIFNINLDSGIPAYLQIKRYIEGLIKDGNLKPGTKLPSSRNLAKSLGVSRNTVIQAYSLLEAEEFVSSGVGRGTFVKPFVFKDKDADSGSREKKYENFDLGIFLSSSWRRVAERFLQDFDGHLIAENRAVYNFFNPEEHDEVFFPVDDFKYCISSAFKDYRYNLLSANSSQGFNPLLKKLVDMMRSRGISAEEENIIITSGIQQGLSLIAHLFLDPGDTVVLERFTYPGALTVFRSLRAECVGVPTDSNGVNLDVLETVFKRRNPKFFYCIPTFHNPLGYVLSLEQRYELLNLCMRYRVILLEDDYAHDLYFKGPEPLPIKSIDRSGFVIYMGSFSETMFPGVRISWIVAPHGIIKKLSALKKSTDLYTNLILQGAVLEFIRKGFFHKYLKKKINLLRKLSSVLYNAMNRYFADLVKYRKLEGGVYQWIELPKEIDSLELLARARARRVIFAPDRMFSVNEWEKSGLRLSFWGLDEIKIWEGIKLLASVVKEKIK